jgi:ubiquinol-cytochrome c reductase iron-sulfur subunit
MMPNENRRPSMIELGIALAFLASLCGTIGFAATYWVGGQTQLEGAFGAAGLAAFAVGLGLWANAATASQVEVQQREPLPSTVDERETFVEDFERGEHVLVRRKALLMLAGSGLAAGGIAALFPFRSLGPRPGDALRHTDWKPGARLVDATGAPVKADSLPVGTALTVYPEGDVGSATSQTVLINFGDAAFKPGPGRAGWTVDRCVAYSRVCTHAGCPVGVYEAESHKLMCPCHQSLFDVLDAANPQFGPASRPLPQLPIATDAAGYLVAQADFDEPVGPGFWNR